MSDMIKLILMLAVLTYATRFGGHVILSRFKRINPRVEAALDAVPAAVITALVVSAAFTTGIPEFIGAAMAVLLSFRFSMLNALVLSTATVAVLRYLL